MESMEAKHGETYLLQYGKIRVKMKMFFLYISLPSTIFNFSDLRTHSSPWKAAKNGSTNQNMFSPVRISESHGLMSTYNGIRFNCSIFKIGIDMVLNCKQKIE
jgi:hypothetical protein